MAIIPSSPVVHSRNIQPVDLPETHGLDLPETPVTPGRQTQIVPEPDRPGQAAGVRTSAADAHFRQQQLRHRIERNDIAITPSQLRRPAQWALSQALRSIRGAGDDLTRAISHLPHHLRGTARAGASIFRRPEDVGRLVDDALSEGIEMVAQHGDELPERFLLQGDDITVASFNKQGLASRRQYVVSKELSEEIGERGERHLQVVVDEGGKVISAIPARPGVVANDLARFSQSLPVIGGLAGVAGAFAADDAQAEELSQDAFSILADTSLQAQQALENERQARAGGDNGVLNFLRTVAEFLDPTGILAAEGANSGEDFLLAIEAGVVRYDNLVQQTRGYGLDSNERAQVREQLEVAALNAYAINQASSD